MVRKGNPKNIQAIDDVCGVRRSPVWAPSRRPFSAGSATNAWPAASRRWKSSPARRLRTQPRSGFQTPAISSRCPRCLRQSMPPIPRLFVSLPSTEFFNCTLSEGVRFAVDLYGAFSVKRLFWVCCQFFVRRCVQVRRPGSRTVSTGSFGSRMRDRRICLAPRRRRADHQHYDANDSQAAATPISVPPNSTYLPSWLLELP